jgi:hypothetical protein
MLGAARPRGTLALRTTRRDGAIRGSAMTLLLAALLPALLPEAAGAAGSVQVTLTPQRLALGDTAQLTFMVSRSDLGHFQFAPRFELDNFQIVGGPSRQENMSWENGNLSRTYAVTWYLSPRRPGKARVHTLKLLTEGQELALPDQEAFVDESRPDENGRDPAARAPADPFDQIFRDLFPRRAQSQNLELPEILLRAEVSPAKPWAGQQVLYTLYLLAERRAPGEGRVVVETIFPRRVPPFQGFWSQEIQLPEAGHAEIVELGGKLWWRQPILQRALFPYEPGEHTIEAAQADLRLVYLRPIGFGFGEEPVRPGTVRRQSNALSVSVQKLPPAPPAFAGAVGQLRARATLAPGSVAAGETVVLTAELSGGGNLSGLPDPNLPSLPGVQVSPPQESSRQQVDGTRVDSTRTWTWSLVPQRAGSWQLPPIEWVTFDPTSGRYRTLSTPALALAATPAAPAPKGPRRVPPPARSKAPALPASPAAWAVGGAAGTLLLVALTALALHLWRGDRKARRELVAQVTAALGEAQPRQAAGAAEEAWRSFLGRRYDLPAEAPPAHWATLLAKRGLGPALAGELVRLVDDLHYLRYAPRLASTDSLQRELLDRSRRLARRLR